MKLLTLLLLSTAHFLVATGQLRIVGDRVVKSETEFPYQVAIRKHGEHVCGGGLVSDRHVLTAAHCIGQPIIPVSAFEVLVGSKILGIGESHRVRRIAVHKNYNNSTYDNDIAIIQLQKKVKFSLKVQKINLPRKPFGETRAGTKVVVSGFGSAYLNGPQSKQLKQYHTTVMSLSQCREMNDEIVPPSKICTVSYPLNKHGHKYNSACTGDSGAPLVDVNEKIVIGVLSSAEGECDEEFPDLYTKVSHFLDFIGEEMNYFTDHPYESGDHPSDWEYDDTDPRSPWHELFESVNNSSNSDRMRFY